MSFRKIDLKVEDGLLRSGGVVATRNAQLDFVVSFIAEGGQQLTELIWRPGEMLELRAVPLSAAVPEYPTVASAADRFLAVSNAGERLTLVDRETGEVHTLGPIQQPAGLVDSPRMAIGVTSRGLLAYGLNLDAGRPPRLGPVSPLAVYETDSPRSALVVPGLDAGTFAVAVGGYGSVSLATVKRVVPTIISVSEEGNAGLPYDPLYLRLPAPLLAGPGRYGFVVDEGGCGVGAIDLGSGAVLPFPQVRNPYGSVSLVVPHLEGYSCLVLFKREWLWWRPDRSLVPQRFKGTPVAFQDDRVLVLNGNRLREVVVTG